MVANKFLMGEGDTPTHVYKPRQRTEGTGKKAHLPVSPWKGLTFILSQLLLESLASHQPVSRCHLWSPRLRCWQALAKHQLQETTTTKKVACIVTKVWETAGFSGWADWSSSSSTWDHAGKTVLSNAQKPTKNENEGIEKKCFMQVKIKRM